VRAGWVLEPVGQGARSTVKTPGKIKKAICPGALLHTRSSFEMPVN